MSIRVGLESVTDVRAMLEGLFEHAPTAFGVVSAAGKTVAVNQAFLDLFGSHPPPEYSIFEDEITKDLEKKMVEHVTKFRTAFLSRVKGR